MRVQSCLADQGVCDICNWLENQFAPEPRGLIKHGLGGNYNIRSFFPHLFWQYHLFCFTSLDDENVSKCGSFCRNVFFIAYVHFF